MKTFIKPEPDQLVNIVATRYRATVLNREFDEHVYENVTVIPSEKWDNPMTFRIPSDQPHIDVRVIDVRNVVSLVVDGKAADTFDFVESQTVKVEGSKGQVYDVTFGSDGEKCSCVGFSFRKTCKHLKIAQDSVDL